MITQNLELTVGKVAFDVRRFSVREELSSHFHITVWCRIGDPRFNPEEFIAAPATFTARMDRTSRSWQGGVKRMELVRGVAERADDKQQYWTYMVEIVPQLWFTTQVRQRRIFQHKPLPDIVEEVLEPYQIKVKRELGDEYPDHEYIVQYGETDYELVNRLLEQAGITYFYRFGAKTELILNDKPVEAKKRSVGIHYVDEPNPESKDDYVTKVRIAHRVRPGKVTVRDYDFRRQPDFPLWESKDADDFKALEFYYYEPGSFLVEKGGTGDKVADDKGIARHETSQGQAHAERILGSLRRGRRTVGFTTNALDLAPGVVFCIEQHPHSEVSDSTKLLVNEFTLNGSPVSDWVITSEATFCDDDYQPARLSRKTRIPGVQSAITTAPNSEEIYTDEFGRVRAQFHWDREGKGISEGEAATKWMRVSQAWAGRQHGAMLIPRKGHELMVRYYEGDPEMPAVVGRVYNKLQPVPYPLPKHDIKSVWKTDTTPHTADSYNEIRLDDRKDLELFYTQAQRDRFELVQHNEFERTGINRANVVGKSRWTIVGEKDNTMVGKTVSIQMVKPPSEKDLRVLQQRMPKLAPKPTKLTMSNKKITTTTAGATLEMDDKEVIFEAKGEISVKGSMVIIEGGPKVKINCGSSHSGQVIGSPGNIKLTADGKEKGEFTHLVEKLQKKQRRPAKPYEIKWKNGPPTRTEPKDVPESETDKRNYFVALKVPPGPWLDRLKEDAPPDLEFQHPEDLHMTVAYLGKIGEAAANEAFDSLAGMAAPPIEATLESMEVLGGAIALSPTDGNDASKTLMGSIKEPLELEAGRQPDERQPRPHVTVATTSGTAAKRREAAAQWAEGASPTPAPVKLDTLGLYVRNDGPGKPAFKLIRSKKLSG